MANRFTHCISNPPYQESARGDGAGDGGNNNARNIFQHFYELGLNIAESTSMIFPGGRWMQRQSKSGAISDLIMGTVSRVHWYPNGKEKDQSNFPFYGTMINDGVSVVHATTPISGEIFVNGAAMPRPAPGEILPLGGELANLIAAGAHLPKVFPRRYSRNFFGLPSYFSERFPGMVAPAGDGFSKEPPGDGNIWVKAFLADAKPGSAKRVREYWLRRDAVVWTEERLRVFNSYKVYIIQASASKCPELGPYLIAPQGCAVGESWLIVGAFDSLAEAEGYKAYLDLPESRALLAASKGGNIRTWGYFLPDLGSYAK